MGNPEPAFSTHQRQRLLAQTMAAAAIGAFVLTAAARFILLAEGFSNGFLTVAVGIYLAGALIVIGRIEAFHPHARFGLANMVTLIRLALASLLAGFAAALFLRGQTPSGAWVLFILAAAGLACDALDGWAARATGLASAFGARFDMEVDAFLILVLSVLAFGLGKAGPWVLAAGLMRYAYVAAGMIWPVLAGTVPPALRRKVIAAVQGCTLAAVLMPIVAPPVSGIAAAAALLLLTYSFGTDIMLLIRSRRS